MPKNKTNYGLYAVIIMAAALVAGGFYYASSKQTTIQQESGSCEIAPTLTVLEYQADDQGTPSDGYISVYQNGNRLTNTLNTATEFSTGLKKGEVTLLLHANESESTSGFYPNVLETEVDCGDNTVKGFVKEKTAVTVSSVINNDGLTANSPSNGKQQAIGDGDSVTFEIKLQGASKKHSGDCGQVIVLDINTTMLKKADTVLEGLGATEVSVPDVHNVGAVGESPKAWQIDPISGSALQSVFLTMLEDDASSTVNPLNYSHTLTIYDMQSHFENAQTGDLETGCYVEDEANNDLGLGTTTKEILTT